MVLGMELRARVCARQMLGYGAVSANLSSGLLPFLLSLFLSIAQKRSLPLTVTESSHWKLPASFLDEQG